ncbi:MAG: Xaa-Pro peptidase family protein, partial [Eubacterium sp.]
MPLSQKFYINNREILGKKLGPESVSIIYSGRAVKQSLDADYPFYTDNNFYYLTGIEEPNVTLVAVKDANAEVKWILFIDEGDALKEKWVGAKISMDEASLISGITDVRYYSELEACLLSVRGYNALYFDFTTPKHQSFSTSAPELKMMIAEMEIKNLQPFLTEMRLIKTDEEVSVLREAIEITHQGINAILENIKPGMKEYEMQALFEYTIKRLGAQGVSFETIAASGKNATILHYIKNRETLMDNELVLFDLGARLKGYCGDISRTIPISGKYTDEQRKIYNIVLTSQKELIKMYKPSAKMKDIQQMTKELFLDKCSDHGIAPENNDISMFYYHGVGHSLGLDTHDTNDKRD